MEWDLGNKHLLVLQTKINSYLSFIESGEIFDSYPLAHGKKMTISIMALHSPHGDAMEFLDRVKETVNRAGLGFRFQQRDMESESK